MITLSQLTTLLGWTSLINIGILILMGIFLIALKSLIMPIHSKMFNIPAEDLTRIYFKYLGGYKMLVMIFFIIPYISLKVMGQ